MSILYFDCAMGAAGDMLTAALLELLPDPEAFVGKLNSLGIAGVSFVTEKSVKCGICGTHVRVLINGNEEDEQMNDNSYQHSEGHHHSHEDDGHDHEHSHHHMQMTDIQKIVSGLNTDEKVKKDIIAVYGIIAEAESHVHGVPVTEIHFHEVGNLDAIADVAAVCLLLDEIKPDRVICSPIHVGSGTVRCAHGMLPVPAPATAYILNNIPVYSENVRGELCTPTGAALLKYFTDQFSGMPLMRINKTGYGMGTRDFETANCVRALLGTEEEAASDQVYQLSCNIDDMTGEEIGFAVGKLIDLGARDVYTVPVMMKKNRPGILLNVICSKEDRKKFAEAIFAYTSTIGIREAAFDRYVLKRRVETVKTSLGEIKKKISEGYGVRKEKYEYDDVAEIADRNGLSISEVRDLLKE